MKQLTPTLFALVLFFGVFSLKAQDRFVVTVTHDLATARTAETIVIPFQEVRARIPNVLLDCVVVRNARGEIIPAQVTNFTPEARPVLGDELIWQHDFAAGEKSATFIIERTKKPVPPFPRKTFARYIPERLDDFAWENDVIAHRMYGPRLDSDEAGKSRMISSGIDVWVKSVRYPIVDRWYLKGHDAYHVNSGEGLDMYDVGTNRGAGGTGIWRGGKIHNSRNWITWKILANGPVRTVFELTYDSWDADGVRVAETKRFTVDAGRNLDRVDSLYSYNGSSQITVAIGLSKPPRNATYKTGADERRGWISNWATYRLASSKEASSSEHGSIGAAALLPEGAHAGFAEDNGNHYILTHAVSGKPVVYYIGACWDRDGTERFSDKADWETYLNDFALRLQHPLKIEYAAHIENQ